MSLGSLLRVLILSCTLLFLAEARVCKRNTVMSEGQNDTDCEYLAYHPNFFSQVIGSNPQMRVIATGNFSFAHEGTAYFPETQDFFFSTNRQGDPLTQDQFIDVMKINLNTLVVSTVIDGTTPDTGIYMTNGMTKSLDGTKIIAASQGQIGIGGSIVQIDPVTGVVETIVDNWFGLPFNSPNDVRVSRKDGSIWFTDPDYGYIQNFRDPPQVGKFVWRYDVAHDHLHVLAEDINKPNGIALSLDEKKLYVSDSGYFDERPCCTEDPTRPHTIYQYDIDCSEDGYPTLSNKRVFAVSSRGVPDGLHVDCHGNLYSGEGTGISVYAPSGQILGQILIPGGAANFGFAEDTIIALAETDIYQVKINNQC